jgi:tRNA(Ile)-lysidine synthetase-like protein
VSLVQGRNKSAAPSPPVPLPVPGRVEWGDVMVTAEVVDGFRAPDVACEAFVDADGVSGGLEVRGSRAGDRMRPLGAPGTRKLKDILVDRRVPTSGRARRPLVVCDERVIWVCGLLVAEEAKITRDTKRFLRLSIAPVRRGDAGQDQG